MLRHEESRPQVYHSAVTAGRDRLPSGILIFYLTKRKIFMSEERSKEIRLKEGEWLAIINLMMEKERICVSMSKRIGKMGYGKASTLEKAKDKMNEAEYWASLYTRISESLI